METCVQNGYYEDALNILAYTKQIVKKYGEPAPIVQLVANQSQQISGHLFFQLCKQLREPITLPICLKVVIYLRQLEIFTEQELRLNFLQARSICLNEQMTLALSKPIAQTASTLISIGGADELLSSSSSSQRAEYEAYIRIMRRTEVTRVQLFDSITQYRAVFADEESYSKLGDPKSSGRHPSLADMTPLNLDEAPGYLRHANLNFIDGLAAPNEGSLFHVWLVCQISSFLTALTNDLAAMLSLPVLSAHEIADQLTLLASKDGFDLGALDDTGAVTSTFHRVHSLMAQSLYFGRSFARIGCDFRPHLASIFSDGIMTYFEGLLANALTEFSVTLDLWPWEVDFETPDELNNNDGETSADDEGEVVKSPSMLLKYPPLAVFCNHLLVAFNGLRIACPVGLKQRVVTACVQTVYAASRQIVFDYRAKLNRFPLSGNTWTNFRGQALRTASSFTYSLSPHILTCLLDHLFADAGKETLSWQDLHVDTLNPQNSLAGRICAPLFDTWPQLLSTENCTSQLLPQEVIPPSSEVETPPEMSSPSLVNKNVDIADNQKLDTVVEPLPRLTKESESHLHPTLETSVSLHSVGENVESKENTVNSEHSDGSFAPVLLNFVPEKTEDRTVKANVSLNQPALQSDAVVQRTDLSFVPAFAQIEEAGDTQMDSSVEPILCPNTESGSHLSSPQTSVGFSIGEEIVENERTIVNQGPSVFSADATTSSKSVPPDNSLSPGKHVFEPKVQIFYPSSTLATTKEEAVDDVQVESYIEPVLYPNEQSEFHLSPTQTSIAFAAEQDVIESEQTILNREQSDSPMTMIDCSASVVCNNFADELVDIALPSEKPDLVVSTAFSVHLLAETPIAHSDLPLSSLSQEPSTIRLEMERQASPTNTTMLRFPTLSPVVAEETSQPSLPDIAQPTIREADVKQLDVISDVHENLFKLEEAQLENALQNDAVLLHQRFDASNEGCGEYNSIEISSPSWMNWASNLTRHSPTYEIISNTEFFPSPIVKTFAENYLPQESSLPDVASPSEDVLNIASEHQLYQPPADSHLAMEQHASISSLGPLGDPFVYSPMDVLPNASPVVNLQSGVDGSAILQSTPPNAEVVSSTTTPFAGSVIKEVLVEQSIPNTALRSDISNIHSDPQAYQPPIGLTSSYSPSDTVELAILVSPPQTIVESSCISEGTIDDNALSPVDNKGNLVFELKPEHHENESAVLDALDALHAVTTPFIVEEADSDQTGEQQILPVSSDLTFGDDNNHDDIKFSVEPPVLFRNEDDQTVFDEQNSTNISDSHAAFPPTGEVIHEFDHTNVPKSPISPLPLIGAERLAETKNEDDSLDAAAPLGNDLIDPISQSISSVEDIREGVESFSPDPMPDEAQESSASPTGNEMTIDGPTTRRISSDIQPSGSIFLPLSLSSVESASDTPRPHSDGDGLTHSRVKSPSPPALSNPPPPTNSPLLGQGSSENESVVASLTTMLPGNGFSSAQNQEEKEAESSGWDCDF